ncbi:MAG TPA: hypothetical protein VIV11_00575 [Kofleriaceae bacterium]
MSTKPITKAWYLLLAANENQRTRTPREPSYFALPCETFDDLATQLALHGRSAQRTSN